MEVFPFSLLAGIDDAGRGSVIGPLVIAGVLIETDKLRLLKALGVKDSKLLSSSKRRLLASQIKDLAMEVIYVIIDPRRIDEIVFRGKKLHRLNYLEAEAMANIVRRLNPDVVYVDAPDILEKRFGETIQALLPYRVKIVSKHYADKKYPIVSAASIMAKVKRDELIEKLRARYGDFGSGYPTDLKTRKFLLEWLKKHGSYPDFVRKSWKTARTLMNELMQKHLM